MKTYRIENWDLLGCNDGGEQHSHVGGQIYGHADYPDGTWVMSDRVLYYDNDLRQAQTMTTGLLQLGEMSAKMRQKELDVAASKDNERFKDAIGRTITRMLTDQFQRYDPSEWSADGKHQGVQEATEALNDLLKQVFGRPGAPDTGRKH